VACYRPTLAYKSLKKNASGKYPLLFKNGPYAGELLRIPCGGCIGCRVDYSDQWATRIMHEAQMHQDTCYLTLTYDDEKVPFDGSVNKSDLRAFWKSLRNKIAPTKVRYVQCGEYGDKFGRPHYHAAVFGYDPKDKQKFKKNKQGQWLYRSDSLNEIWGHGFVTIGKLERASARYIAGYIFKKITGEKSEEHYTVVSREGTMHQLHPEFITMSNRPGIGHDWIKQFRTDVFPWDFVPLSDGTQTKTPAYYVRWLEKHDPEGHQKVKMARRKLAIKLKPDNTYPRLEVKETCKKAKLKNRKRDTAEN